MAMQLGAATSKIFVLIGAGVTGSYLLKNGQLVNIFHEIQNLLKGISDSAESGDSENVAVLEAQLRRLTQEIRNIKDFKPIIFTGNGSSSGNLTTYLVPALTFGAVGYCYMWWKGLTFSDFMYVTKRNMSNVVASVTKQLDQVSAALASTKRHLTQRIEGLDGKLDDQKEMSKLIKNDVFEVREDVQQIGFDIDQLQRMVSGLEGKILSLEDKQDFANAGVWYLCQFVGGAKDGKMSEFLQNVPKARLENPAANSDAKSLKGLQFIADTIQSGAMEKTKAEALLHNEIDALGPKADIKKGRPPVPRSLTRASLNRTISIKDDA